MINLLNDNMRECYLVTGEVVVKYFELYELIIQNSFEDISIYETYIYDVFELVKKEYDVYRNLSLYDVNAGLNLIKNIDCDKLMVDSRFKYKLETLKDIYSGFKISTDELNLNFIGKEMEFTLFIGLSSLIDIEVMKRLRNKIDVISSNNYNDLLFIKSLNKYFDLILFNQTYGNNLFEMINLSCNMNILNIPVININILIDKINTMFSINKDSSFKPIDATLVEIAGITVNRLVEVNFENNPKVVFNNLLFTTRLDVISSYMSKDSLLDLLNYCEIVRNKNSFGITNAIKLIKNNLKNL